MRLLLSLLLIPSIIPFNLNGNLKPNQNPILTRRKLLTIVPLSLIEKPTKAVASTNKKCLSPEMAIIYCFDSVLIYSYILLYVFLTRF